MYVRNTKDTLSLNAAHYFKFLIAENNEIKASGNVNSMINYSDLTNHCYHSMFYECQGLISAPKLPSTKLADYCYNNMFADCGALNTAPELPATNLTEGCYRTMFARCVSLFSAPLLKINYLARFCCHSMFMNCSDLYIKENNETAVDPLVLDLTNITVPEYSTEDMFSGTSGSFSGTPQQGNKYF
ncbi:MAG: hypothetical protein MJ200_05675 [Mycoplasmoidaceae bacterium]|nr:hypothetical protein [Mycoplasmoidaceae bacterium]